METYNAMRTEIIRVNDELQNLETFLKQEYARLGEIEISSVRECWEGWFKPESLVELSVKARCFGGAVPQINLVLVPRESERRCVFKYAEDLKSGKTVSLVFKTAGSVREMGVSGANLLQKYQNDDWIESVIGPPSTALCCHFEKNSLVFDADMRVLDIRRWTFEPGVRLGIRRNVSNPKQTLESYEGVDFVLNEDCTISSMDADNLVLGISSVEDDVSWCRMAESALDCGLALLKGDPVQTKIQPETCIVCFGSEDISVVGAPFLAAPTGQDTMVFEVDLLSVGSDPFLAIGFAGSFFDFSIDSAGSADSSPACSWFLELVSNNTNENDQVQVKRALDGPKREGAVIGLCLDIRTWTLTASVNGVSLSSEWTAFKEMLPGPSVGTRLYPIIKGKNVQLQCNLGTDLKSNPFKYPNLNLWEGCTAAPFLCQSLSTAPVYARKVLLAGHNQKSEGMCSDLRERLIAELHTHETQNKYVCLPDHVLVSLGLNAESILADFNKIVDEHGSLETIEFNNDACYKKIFNELMNAKQYLLNKQGALFHMLRDGATLKQLQRCSEAPFSDFKQPQYSNDPCRVGFTWASLFSGWICSSLQIVEIPLSLPQCQIAVVWEAVYSAVKAGSKLDSVKLGDEILPASSTITSLSIVTHRLNFIKYEAALAALVSIGTLSVLDETGNEFLPDGPMSNSVRMNTSITSLNCLALSTESHDGSISQVVTRSGENMSLGKLSGVERAFVMARVHEHKWTSILLNSCEVTASAASVLLKSPLPFIQRLDLGHNKLAEGKGLKRFSECFLNLTGLTYLNLGSNQLTGAEIKPLAAGMSSLVNLTSLDLNANSFGTEGMSYLVSYSFPHLGQLADLCLVDCKILEAGGTILASGLRHLTNLRDLNLYANLIRASGAMTLVKEGLCHAPNLSILNLRQNELGADGMQRFLDEGVPLLPNLSVLILSDNEINGAPNEITPEFEVRFRELCQKSYPTLTVDTNPTFHVDF
jgi:Leucine-rich repeat (LRR) protein